jgi:hypothetical protein
VIDVSVLEPLSVVPGGRRRQVAVVVAVTASGDDITKLTAVVSLVTPLPDASTSVVVVARLSPTNTATNNGNRLIPSPSKVWKTRVKSTLA